MFKLEPKHLRYTGYFWIGIVFLICFNWSFYMLLTHKNQELLWEHTSYGLNIAFVLLWNCFYFGAAVQYEGIVDKPEFSSRQRWNWIIGYILLTAAMAWIIFNQTLGLAEYYQSGFIDRSYDD